ncbi:MAG: DUF1786 family protein [Anaerolineae bacterium]
MKILAIDIGTGTQDILLFDTSIEVENCLQIVMPSPTVLVANRIKAATARGEPVLLTGMIMGGGPSAWAAEAHVRRGYPVYATPGAAMSFNDELAEVEKSGIRVVSEDEAARLDARHITLRDLDLDAIARAFDAFGVPLRYDALAVAVFDHGNSPPGYSDRLYRFDFLAERIGATGRLSGFAFMRDAIPARLTRMQAVAQSVPDVGPLMLMDTGPAAILGALDDDRVRAHPTAVVANLGNFHTLAFCFHEGRIMGLFEHHTGELQQEQLEGFLRDLVAGTLTHAAIFNSQGHGALILDRRGAPVDFYAVVGPRRGLLLHSALHPYFAVPYGDMMLAGAYGLVRAYADLNPNARDEIEHALAAARETT